VLLLPKPLFCLLSIHLIRVGVHNHSVLLLLFVFLQFLQFFRCILKQEISLCDLWYLLLWLDNVVSSHFCRSARPFSAMFAMALRLLLQSVLLFQGCW
jgi:hypothetical protein